MKNAQVAVEQSRGIVNPFVRLFGDFPGAVDALAEQWGSQGSCSL